MRLWNWNVSAWKNKLSGELKELNEIFMSCISDMGLISRKKIYIYIASQYVGNEMDSLKDETQMVNNYF